MSSFNQHIIYTAADIQKYLTGKMSNEEMHAIEKAALDDPLLADAIEGYSTVEKQDWQNVFTDLKKQIEANESAPVTPIKKTSAFKWWKAAAAVLLIGITATVAYMFNGTKKGQDIAAIEKAAPAIDSTIKQYITADSIASNATAINESQLKAIKKDDSFLSVQADDIKDNTLLAQTKPDDNKPDDFVYKPSFKEAEPGRSNAGITQPGQVNVSEDKQASIQNIAPSASNKANFSTTQNEITVQPEQKSNIEPSVQAPQKSITGYNNLNKPLLYYAGIVKSNNGDPLSFASLRVNNNKLFTADVNGSFSIPATDTILSIEVASAGFTPKKFQLNPSVNNNLILQSSNAGLNEVVITSGVAKDKAKKRVSSVTDEVEETAEPNGGWDSYNEYLNNNIHVPGNNGNHGTVEALVKLNRKGEVADVKITRSVSTECDKEAVRLIKKGPGWKVKPGKKGVGKVKVQFPE